MRSFLVALAALSLSACSHFADYPNGKAEGCYMAGDAVVTINGQTCVGLGYPPFGYGGYGGYRWGDYGGGYGYRPTTTTRLGPYTRRDCTDGICITVNEPIPRGALPGF